MIQAYASDCYDLLYYYLAGQLRAASQPGRQQDAVTAEWLTWPDARTLNRPIATTTDSRG